MVSLEPCPYTSDKLELDRSLGSQHSPSRDVLVIAGDRVSIIAGVCACPELPSEPHPRSSISQSIHHTTTTLLPFHLHQFQLPPIPPPSSLKQSLTPHPLFSHRLRAPLSTRLLAFAAIMPGFDFTNYNRNAALHARGVPLPKATSTGTTIVGCIYDNGVVVC